MSEQSVDKPGSDDRRDEPKPARAAKAKAAETGPTFAEAQPRVLDLSKEIAQTVAREVGERVTCRWISGNHYRCNWWSSNSTREYDNPSMEGLLVTTHRVSRSEMLLVTRSEMGLDIKTSPVRTR